MLRIDMNEWRLFLTYRKGVAAEQQLARWLKDRKYETQRAAGSRGAADIMAAKKELLGLSKRKFAIQVKATNADVMKMAKEDIEALREYSDKFESVAVIAVRFGGEKWRFWTEETEDPFVDNSTMGHILRGKEPYATLDVHSKKAALFEEVF